jgi:amino acid permease
LKPVSKDTRKATNPFISESLLVNGGGADLPSSGKSSLSTAAFNLVKGIVGAGVLSLPSGIAAFGDAPTAIIPAIIFITSVGMLSGYNFSLIGRICAATGASSYSTAWEKTIGASTAWVPAMACTFKTFFAILAYSMVLAETFQGIFKTFGFVASRAQTLVTLTSVILLPLCLMKNLASLAPFSLLGIIGMVFTILSMAVRYLDGSYSLPAGKLLSDLAANLQPSFGSKGAASAMSPNSLLLICMLSTAYMAHFNAPKFYNELENNTVERFNTLVSTSFGVSILLFSAAAGIGFATFGKACSGFILSNYSNKDALISLSRIAVAVSLIFTYPLVFTGCRDGVLDLAKVPKDKRTHAMLDKITLVLLSLVTFVAINLQDLSFVLSFGGATLGNALIYIFPALMFRKSVKDLGPNASKSLQNEVYFTNISGLIGLVVGLIGANMALKNQGGGH